MTYRMSQTRRESSSVIDSTNSLQFVISAQPLTDLSFRVIASHPELAFTL
jgi:hypothetical protein